MSEAHPERPATRGDCVDGLRPCPWATCRWHIAQVRSYRGMPWDEVPDVEEWAATCVLDVADQGGATLDQVGQALGVSRERVRQLEARAVRLFHSRTGRLLDGFVNDERIQADELAVEPEGETFPVGRPQNATARVARVLRRSAVPMGAREVAAELGITAEHASMQLLKLRRAGQAQREREPRSFRGSRFVYRWLGGRA